jgi:hypothetical protein
VQLAIADYNHSQSLTVDPLLEFSTYIGGPGDDFITDIKVNSAGFVYLAGASQSPQAPALNPFQQSAVAQLAPFVLKFTSDGQHVVYYAVVGGNGWDDATGIVVDGAGSPTIVGRTRSTNFPVKNAFQTISGSYLLSAEDPASSFLSTRRMCTVVFQWAREHHRGANARSNLEPPKFERSEMGFLGERRDRSVQEQLLYPPIRRFG